ncbi:MAG: hypothetical protein IH986_15595 [Planctomycetes bacterium]|nr:hypothetical protein [Planctomycetota bacterium]
MRNILCLLVIAAIATQAHAQPTFWVSTRGAGPHHIDEFNEDGTGTGNAFDQVAGAQASAWGYRDGMADRNGHLYWGWDGGVAMHFMDGSGGTQIISGSAPGGVGTYRAMAYDPSGDRGNGSFWVQSFTTGMCEVTMTGDLIRSWPNNGTVVYGFAFDDFDSNVWAHEGLGDVVKIDVTTGNTIPSTRFPSGFPNPGAPGGLSGFHDGTGRMAALMQGSPDLWGIYDTSGGFTGPYDVEIVTGENGNLGIAGAFFDFHPRCFFVGICGDTNCDGLYNGGDIDPFFVALAQPAVWVATYPNCDLVCAADINGDGLVNGGDIDPFFVAILLGVCPSPSPIPPPARDLQITDFNRPANPPANDVQSP